MTDESAGVPHPRRLPRLVRDAHPQLLARGYHLSSKDLGLGLKRQAAPWAALWEAAYVLTGGGWLPELSLRSMPVLSRTRERGAQPQHRRGWIGFPAAGCKKNQEEEAEKSGEQAAGETRAKAIRRKD